MLACWAPARIHAAWVAAWRGAHRLRGRADADAAAVPFYGFAVFVLSTLISLVTYSSTIDVLGLFFASFVADLGLSRSAVTSLLLVGTLLCGLLQPYTGALIDRLGARAVACVSMCLHAAGLLLLAAARSPAVLGLGFVVVRVGGISGTFLAQDAVLTKWWVRKRGTAVAMQRVVMAALAISAMPMAIGAVLPRVGWRATLALLALPLLAAVPTAGALLLPTPEGVGLLPDGDVAPKAAGAADVASAAHGEELLPLWADTSAPPAASAPSADCSASVDCEVQWSAREAMRCRCFWVLLLIGFAVCCCTGGITAHAALIAADAGLDLRAMSRAVLLPSACVSLVANFAAGRALDGDTVSVRALFAFSEATLAAAATAALAMGAAATPGRRTACAACFGGLYGAGTAVYYFLYKVSFAKFFGRRSIGAIMGVANAVMFAAIGVGPVLFGVSRDARGSYDAALRASAATCAAAAAAAWLAVVPPAGRPGAGGAGEADGAGGDDAAAGEGGRGSEDDTPLLLPAHGVAAGPARSG